jgi:succinate-semialdehyde dehydrogenase/glutarate-semialdehyde dehydrogenase
MAEQAELTRPETRDRIQTVNPATGEPGRSYDWITIDEALEGAAAAHRAFLDWRRTSFEDRARVVRKAGEILRTRKDEFARLMTEEMGKTVEDGRAEVEKCATNCDWFADHAHEYLAEERVDIGGPEAFVTYNPLGVVLAVMPWNFPFWQVFRFVAPALMAGNGALLKHASNVPGSALAIEDVLHQAGVPRDLFRTLLLPTRDVEAAAKIAATARMENGGQSCIAGKRFIVVRAILDRFTDALVGAMRGYEMGDPTKEGTKLGPMQSVKARDEIHRQVKDSVANGAKLLLGGEVPDRPGAWYPATVLADVRPGQPAHDEEVFGPVAAIIAAEDEADAIRIANASEFGLGSGVLTGDPDRGRRIAAQELEAGLSFVNENVRSDPRMPFGGVKHSGYGRECSSFGIREFTNIKSVHVRPLEHGTGNAVE